MISLCTMLNNVQRNCIFLNPYATLYRYPEGDLMPELNEVKKAFVSAKRILDLVKTLLEKTH